MDIFTQRKLLIRIVILMTVLNLLLIGMILWKDIFRKPPRRYNQDNQNSEVPGEKPKDNRNITEVLKKELHLSKEQVDQIRVLRSSFFETERSISDAIKNERDSMNILMFNNDTNEEQVRSLARRVAENDYRMELMRFEQAQEFKKICNPAQLEKFEGLIIEIRDYFKTEDKPKKRPD